MLVFIKKNTGATWIDDTQIDHKIMLRISILDMFESVLQSTAEPEFLNVYGAQESIPMNQFRQTM